MNKALTILLSVLSLFATISCSKELDVTENIITGFVTLWTDSNGNISVLEDDFGKRFMVDDKDGTKEPADTVLRVISMYIVNADSTTATVLETINILSNRATDICECENREIKQDPVKVQSVWLSGGYMNAVIQISVHHTPHSLFIIADKKDNGVDFILYHDRNNDPIGSTKNAYFSVPLDGYDLQKGDSITFSCKGDGADFHYAFEL